LGRFSSQVYSLEIKVDFLDWDLDPLYKAMSYTTNLRKLSLINGDSEFLDLDAISESIGVNPELESLSLCGLGIGVVGTCAYVL
jgi:hypothetical protein